jgi:hypothetical protein
MSPGEAEIETRVSEGIVDARWWSVDEIEATPERVFPLDLAQRVRELESRAG